MEMPPIGRAPLAAMFHPVSDFNALLGNQPLFDKGDGDKAAERTAGSNHPPRLNYAAFFDRI